MQRNETVRSVLALFSLVTVAALALVAPSDCGCALDIHHGEPLHFVFNHSHPDAASEQDGLSAIPSGVTLLQGAHLLDPGGPAATSGEVLPRLEPLPEPVHAIVWLAHASDAESSSQTRAPPDPPPELA